MALCRDLCTTWALNVYSRTLSSLEGKLKMASKDRNMQLSSINIKYTLIDIVVFDYIPFPTYTHTHTHTHNVDDTLPRLGRFSLKLERSLSMGWRLSRGALSQRVPSLGPISRSTGCLLELRRMPRSSHLESHWNWSASTPQSEAFSEKSLEFCIRCNVLECT